MWGLTRGEAEPTGPGGVGVEAGCPVAGWRGEACGGVFVRPRVGQAREGACRGAPPRRPPCASRLAPQGMQAVTWVTDRGGHPRAQPAAPEPEGAPQPLSPTSSAQQPAAQLTAQPVSQPDTPRDTAELPSAGRSGAAAAASDVRLRSGGALDGGASAHAAGEEAAVARAALVADAEGGAASDRSSASPSGRSLAAKPPNGTLIPPLPPGGAATSAAHGSGEARPRLPGSALHVDSPDPSQRPETVYGAEEARDEEEEDAGEEEGGAACDSGPGNRPIKELLQMRLGAINVSVRASRGSFVGGGVGAAAALAVGAAGGRSAPSSPRRAALVAAQRAAKGDGGGPKRGTASRRQSLGFKPAADFEEVGRTGGSGGWEGQRRLAPARPACALGWPARPRPCRALVPRLSGLLAHGPHRQPGVPGAGWGRGRGARAGGRGPHGPGWPQPHEPRLPYPPCSTGIVSWWLPPPWLSPCLCGPSAPPQRPTRTSRTMTRHAGGQRNAPALLCTAQGQRGWGAHAPEVPRPPPHGMATYAAVMAQHFMCSSRLSILTPPPVQPQVDVYSLAVLMYELLGRTSISYTHMG
jgi:hypothetical protein